MCTLTSGYTLECRKNLGGVKSIAIGSFARSKYATDATNNDVITGYEVDSPEVTYHIFETEIESASFNQTAQISAENHTVFMQQEVTLSMFRNTSALLKTVVTLLQANLSVIIKDQTDRYWLVGRENGVRATAATVGTGKAFSDMNGSSITLLGKEPLFATEVVKAAIDIWKPGF